MKYVELADHLHKLREARTGRPRGAAMRAMEVWQAVPESQLTDVSELLYFDVDLPRPIDGLFARLGKDGEPSHTAIIVTHRALPKHWKEFVAIKEMMHCWSDRAAFVGSPDEAKALAEALISTKVRYTASVAADHGAILAAAEVILPHYTVEWHESVGHDHAQIAAHHGLHPDIVELICRFDILHARKNGDAL